MTSNLALIAAGAVGIVTAVLHGLIMQKRMIVPLQALADADPHIPRATNRLIGPLLHVSTLAWFVTGCLLVWAGARLAGEPRWVISATAVLIYGHAALANLQAVRGFHPGWALMGAAVVLILLAAL